MNTAAIALAAAHACQQADALLLQLRAGLAPPDALHEVFRRLYAAGDDAVVRAYCRTIQKALEAR